MADPLPLPPPQVPLTRPDTTGKSTQQGFEFLERMRAVLKTLANTTNIFDNLNSAAADTLLQSLLNDNYEALGLARGVNTQTASYVLGLGDAGQTVEMNVAGANTLTIPPNSSVAFPLKTYVNIAQIGAGQTTLTAGAGVTLRAYNAGLKLSGQYAIGTLYKRAADEWVCGGNLTP